MITFLIGLIVFLGAHLFTALARGARANLISKMGDGAYKGLYSVVSLTGLILIIVGWPNADATVLYAPPAWLRHVTYLLMLIAFVLVAAAYLPAGKIAETVKHPMLASVKVWAFAHLLSNGEVRSLLLFGGLLAFAVIDRIAVKRRGEPVRTAASMKNDFIAIIVGVILYAAVFFFLHRYIAGVALA